MMALALLLFLMSVVVMVWGFAKIWYRLGLALRVTHGVEVRPDLLRKIQRAKHLALQQVVGIIASSVSSLAVVGTSEMIIIYVNVSLLPRAIDAWVTVWYDWVIPNSAPWLISVDILANAGAAVVLSGAHRRAAIPDARALHGRTPFGSACCMPCLMPCFSHAYHKGVRQSSMAHLPWHDKVAELASRGITLDGLLRFYTGLGHRYMPHYSTALHTTADVVRQAIIPESKASQSSLASVLMSGKCIYPQKMVTHTWRNLFRDLVAAVVADALGEPSFGMIAKLLEEDVSAVEQALRCAGRLESTYWICAFAVNQHSAICGSNPCRDVDPQTGLVHPVCDCGAPKFYNETPPVSPAGMSVDCELNKFDDMLAFLANRNRCFAQVVAVDPSLNLFGRAWCVAELAEAKRLGMAQHLKFRSGRCLVTQEAQVRNLRIEDMSASRMEDVQQILAKIPDKAAFNEALQDLIFNQNSGLLAAWLRLDTEQQMGEAGRILKWHAVGSDAVWRAWDIE
eukprot:CAMPEP_0115178134 /NCGR_PEP_ID=MMETSP0270-20121206/5743_1 /TAXON_ID=71861 /ORGANISM="Scrippsiella trochoidea, Strain CCMP3099" /LENGTH=509 /DNA_ID=CAMNT_0002591085 /DNA_START=593 /DNA_END=2122 /DNA_ORIENTATION=-